MGDIDERSATPTESGPDAEPAIAALARLFCIAKGDTGQAGRVARFLLAWWNASDNGGFDLTDLFYVDLEIGRDMVTVMGFMVGLASVMHFDQLGFADEIRAVLAQWKPQRE